MRRIDTILRIVAEQEKQFRRATFLAPCVRGGRVRAQVAGLVQTFRTLPADFEGWAIFRARDTGLAEVVSEAPAMRVAEYLGLFPALRMHLVCSLSGQTWLAYPANESDAVRRGFTARPQAVHLVTESALFETVIARSVGGWWFEEVDRRADPMLADGLRQAFRRVVTPEDLRLPGLTPEMRTAYGLAAQRSTEFARFYDDQRRTLQNKDRVQSTRQGSEIDASRLREALRLGGGELRDFRDRGEFWQVDWTTGDGHHHTSAISRRDLTVLSAGICLSDRDEDFDLQSLVGVVERRETDW